MQKFSYVLNIAEAFFSVLSEGCNLNSLKYFHIPIFFFTFSFHFYTIHIKFIFSFRIFCVLTTFSSNICSSLHYSFKIFINMGAILS